MTMDISETTQPRSDQINADHFIDGPRTVTITDMRGGSAEQPIEIVTAEYGPGHPYKPGLSMRRVLLAAWGKNGQSYVGRSLTLYRDENITFGGQPAPGIRISHLSHIEKLMKINLTATRGKRTPFTVQPLKVSATTPAPAEPSRDWLSELELAGDDIDAIKALGNAAIAAHVTADILNHIRARRDQLAAI